MHGRDFLRRHERAAAEAVRQGRPGLEDIGPHLLRRAADTRNLRTAWDHLAQYGGQAPGPNGLTYASLSSYDVWELLRTLQSAIQRGTYRHGPDRQVRIPKSSGPGHRTLRLENIEDRVVARAVVQIVQPLLDPLFDERSFGFRPNRDRRHALVEAMRLADSGHQVWVVEDIQDAFDHVPLKRLLDAVRKYLPNAKELLTLAEHIVDNGTKRGLRQGNALSPLLLNLYLDHHLDRIWRKRSPETPLLRTADDLLITCRTEDDARKAYALLGETLLPTGMLLKGTPQTAIRDLNAGEHANWLGYDASLGATGLNVRTGEKAWKKLALELEEAHYHAGAPLRARQILEGWTDQLGPPTPTRNTTKSTRVSRLCARSGPLMRPWTNSRSSSTGGQDMPAGADSWPVPTVRPPRGAALCRRRWTAPPVQLFFRRLMCAEAMGRIRAPRRFPLLAPFVPARASRCTRDGCCDRLRRDGGWAVIIEGPVPDATHGSGYLRRTTNNRAELIAVIKGLERLPGGAPVRIVADSEYVLLGLSERLERWKAQGWRAGCGRHKRPLKNADLWQRIDALLSGRMVHCEWVRGHAGHPQNEACDRMARRAMKRGAKVYAAAFGLRT